MECGGKRQPHAALACAGGARRAVRATARDPPASLRSRVERGCAAKAASPPRSAATLQIFEASTPGSEWCILRSPDQLQSRPSASSGSRRKSAPSEQCHHLRSGRSRRQSPERSRSGRRRARVPTSGSVPTRRPGCEERRNAEMKGVTFSQAQGLPRIFPASRESSTRLEMRGTGRASPLADGSRGHRAIRRSRPDFPATRGRDDSIAAVCVFE